MTFTGDVADHLEAVGQAHLGDLTKRRVRLLRGRGVDARANAALLRGLLQRRHLLTRLLHFPRLSDQLVDRRHPGLTLLCSPRPLSGPLSCRGPLPGPQILRTTRPRGRLPRTNRTKRNRANHSSLSGKRFDATEDRDIWTRQLKAAARASRSCIRIRSRENMLKRPKIALALPSYDRQRLSGIRRGWCPSW
jgi:hypothetical protein